jgi:hypothetical protein
MHVPESAGLEIETDAQRASIKGPMTMPLIGHKGSIHYSLWFQSSQGLKPRHYLASTRLLFDNLSKHFHFFQPINNPVPTAYNLVQPSKRLANNLTALVEKSRLRA